MKWLALIFTAGLTVSVTGQTQSFIIHQDGQEIAPIGGTQHITLEKKPFEIHVDMAEGEWVVVNASEKPENFNLVQRTPGVDSIECFGWGRAMADYRFNERKQILLNDESYNAWTNTEEDHEFNSLERKDGWVDGVREITDILVVTHVNPNERHKVEEYPGSSIYLVYGFRSTVVHDNGERSYIRTPLEYLEIKFRD